MKIAGIDPGSRRAGFAVIEARQGRVEIVEMGVWKLITGSKTAERDLGQRLEILHREASEFLRRHNPHLIGLEKAVSFKNIASAHKLSEARGVLRLAAYQNLEGAGARFRELSPTAVKRFATGSGASDKQSVLKALSLRFANIDRFASEGLAFDAYDALGVAWTTWIHYKQKEGLTARAGARRGAVSGTTGEGRA